MATFAAGASSSVSIKKKAEATEPAEYAPSLSFVNCTQFLKAVNEFGDGTLVVWIRRTSKSSWRNV
jgi:hypothetical protein